MVLPGLEKWIALKVSSYNVHEAKTQFSRLLNLVLEGETVVITRNGVAVAELIPARVRSFPLGAGRNDPTINREALASDEWSHPMNDDEYEAFLETRMDGTGLKPA